MIGHFRDSSRRGVHLFSATLRILAGVLPVVASCLILPGGLAAPSTKSESKWAGRGAPTTLSLGKFRFDPLKGRPSLPDALDYEKHPPRDSFYYVVQLKDRDLQTRKALAGQDIKFLHYVPDNAFIARISPASVSRLRSHRSIRWIGPFEPAFKLSDNLALAEDEVINRLQAQSDPSKAGTQARRPVDTSREIQVDIVAMEPDRSDEIKRALDHLGGKEIRELDSKSGSLRAVVPRASLEALARETAVLWIERSGTAELDSDIASWTIQSNDAPTQARSIHAHGITGGGETVTIGDTGLDLHHEAFADPLYTSANPNHRRITAYYTPAGVLGDNQDNGPSNHGTHVGGIVAGDGGTPGSFDGDGIRAPECSPEDYFLNNCPQEKVQVHDGTAFGGKLQVQDLLQEGQLFLASVNYFYLFDSARNPALRPSGSQNAEPSWIHSDSWGEPWSPAYTSTAGIIDNYLWDQDEFTVIYSAGNRGPLLSTLNKQASGKNMITVGASANGDKSADLALGKSGYTFSSRGPTRDGRIKPDVMAPGEAVWSARGCYDRLIIPPDNNCPEPLPSVDPTSTKYKSYKPLNGTSMSAPAVAAASALVRQYFLDGWYPNGTGGGASITPSSALIKAVLINSSDEMNGLGAYANGETHFPNGNQGWGRIHLDNTLNFQCDPSKLEVHDDRTGLRTGQHATYQFAVGATTDPLKITLAWTDRGVLNPPQDDSRVLVNDLDLKVTAPDGTIFRGNQFQGYNPAESIPNATSANDRDNVEGVLVISDLQIGTWTVDVFAADVPQGKGMTEEDPGPQPYALVIRGRTVEARGNLEFEAKSYRTNGTIQLELADTDLNTNPTESEQTYLLVTSPIEPGGEYILLEETGPDSGVFMGTLGLQAGTYPIADGILQVQNHDTLTAVYPDASGGVCTSGDRVATTVVDDDPPVITNVAVTNLGNYHATISWDTDEPADTHLTYGILVPPATSQSGLGGVTHHAVGLVGLHPNTTYYFAVASQDVLGNQSQDDNGGAYFQFTTAADPTRPADWPTLQGNGARQGSSSGLFLPPLGTPWSQTGGFMFGSSFIMVGGKLYSAEADGYIRTRDAASGSLVWETRPYPVGGFLGTPVVIGDHLYSYTTNEGSSVALTSLRLSDGQVEWSIPPTTFQYWSASALQVSNGLLIARTDTQIIALNPVTQAVVWSGGFPNGAVPQSYAVENGKVFVTSSLTATLFLKVFNAQSGAQLGDFTIESQGLARRDTWKSDVMVAGGAVYVGVGDLDGTDAGGGLYAVDSSNGTVLWSVATQEEVSDTPAYDGSSVYFAAKASTGPGTIYALDAGSGEAFWQKTYSSHPASPLIWANRVVYYSTREGHLLALDAQTGNVLQDNDMNCNPGGRHLAAGTVTVGSNSVPMIWTENGCGQVLGYTATEDPDDDNDGDPDVSDCAPLNSSIFHGRPEVCNGVDDNCTGGVDEGFDFDGDGYTSCGGDCNDYVDSIHPGATEVCNFTDDDCDTLIDEGLDGDGDGFTTCQGDCNNLNAAIHPGATEVCNTVDDDCDGLTDEAPDADGDGYSCANDCNDSNALIFGQESISRYASCFDNLDNDCDGVVDFDCAIDVGDTRTIIGSLTGLPNMRANSSDDVYESIAEGNPGKKAEIYLTFYNPPQGAWWDLRTEAFRVAGNNDNFVLSKSIRTVAGKCDGTASDGTYSTGLTVSNTTDDDRIQFFQFGPPPGGVQNYAFCVRVKDSNQGSDNSVDTLRLDKFYLMPILLHAKAASEIPGIGTLLNGTTYLQTQSSDGVMQAIREAGADEMRHTWRIPGTPIGYTHQLHLEGNRTSSSGGDDFQFYYANPSSGVCPTNDGDYTLIPNAIINVAVGGINADFEFGPHNTLMGTVCIRVRDTVPNSPTLDRLNIDYLAIKTTP